MISRSAGYHVFSFPEMSASAMWYRPVYFQRSAIFWFFTVKCLQISKDIPGSPVLTISA